VGTACHGDVTDLFSCPDVKSGIIRQEIIQLKPGEIEKN
jgi:hypothetical protein